MKKIIISIIVISALIAWVLILDARAEQYFVVEKQDGSIVTITYVDGSSNSLETVLKKHGLLGRPIKPVQKSDFPQDREFRERYWKMNPVPVGKKIVIDNVKKAEDEAAQAQKEARKRSLLKMTQPEYDEAKQLGIF